MLSKHLRAGVCCVLSAVPFLAVQAQEIVPSHAFSAEELVALPTTNWITTNTLKWRREWREICFNGSVATAFAGSDRGDTLWMFSLNGTIEEVTESTPSGPGPGGPPAMSPEVALQADLDNGSTIYDNACVACHGETGDGGQGGGPALTAELSLSQIMLVIHDGKNTMPAFNVLSDQELIDISTFVAEQLKN